MPVSRGPAGLWCRDTAETRPLLTLLWAGRVILTRLPLQSLQVLSLKETMRAALPPTTAARQKGAKPLGADAQQRGGRLLPCLHSRGLTVPPGPQPTPPCLLSQMRTQLEGGRRPRARGTGWVWFSPMSATEGPNLEERSLHPYRGWAPHPHTLGEETQSGSDCPFKVAPHQEVSIGI